MPCTGVSSMEFRVFAEKSECAKPRHGQKYRSHDFKPELVRDSPEGTQSCSNRPFGGADGAIPAGLLSRNPRHHPDLLPGGNFAHALDFNSLRRYNGATAAKGEPFLAPPHLRNEGEPWIRN